MADDSDVLIRSIISARTHYEVLGVANNVHVDEVVRAYKKRAVQCHPDRCKHPKSVEAMQRLTQAKDVLGDAVRRRDYDNHGDNPQPVFRQQARRRHPGQPMDAFDVFEQMFFGGMAGGMPHAAYRRHGAPQPNVYQFQYDPAACLQSGFFLILLLFISFITMWLPSVLANSPEFSFSPDYHQGLTARAVTRRGTVEYFVSPALQADQRSRIEKDVLRAYAISMQRSCRQEQSRQKQLMHEAHLAWSKAARDAKAAEVRHTAPRWLRHDSP